MESGRPLYSIGAVAEMVDISPATLRSWEDRYGVVRAERTPAGQRLYTREHVEHLRFVKEQLAQGLSAADGHRLLRERVGGPVLPRKAKHHRDAEAPSALLAERDPYAAELSEFFLRAAGYAVDVAPTAEEAERAFCRRRPAVVIVELLISGGAGGRLCRRLKELGPVPVLAVSSLAAEEPALEAGADAFLQKPFDPLELAAAVEGLVAPSALVSDPAR